MKINNLEKNYIIIYILSIIVLFLLYKELTRKEAFGTTNDITNAVSQVYTADIEALRNLSGIAKSLMEGNNFTFPGILTVTNNIVGSKDLTISGNITGQKDLTISGNLSISGNITGNYHKPNMIGFPDGGGYIATSQSAVDNGEFHIVGKNKPQGVDRIVNIHDKIITNQIQCNQIKIGNWILKTGPVTGGGDDCLIIYRDGNSDGNSGNFTYINHWQINWGNGNQRVGYHVGP